MSTDYYIRLPHPEDAQVFRDFCVRTVPNANETYMAFQDYTDPIKEYDSRSYRGALYGGICYNDNDGSMMWGIEGFDPSPQLDETDEYDDPDSIVIVSSYDELEQILLLLKV